MPKKISVNFSTLVDLKAELFRKQEQANRQKQERKNDPSSSTTSLYVKGTKPLLHETRKGLPSEKRQELDATVREEERQLAKSRERLEAKAKLYEKLKSGTDKNPLDSDGAALYLVNFEQKSYEERRQAEDEADDSSDSDIPSTSRNEEHGEDDWVEYTDVLGRTRKCLRQDLPNFVAADEKLKKRTDRANEQLSNHDSHVDEKSELLSDDMRRELKRKAWEREEEQATTVRGPVHYQHVAQGETRELGVGYYAFATDEQTRHEQMQVLDQLRQQTMSQRERTQKLKEKREAAMKARLDKVKERKKLKLDGYDDDDSEEDIATASLEDIPLPPSESSAPPKVKAVEASTASSRHMRPWDVGKPRVPQENWVDKQRQERPTEFAPPSFYKN